MSYHVAMERVSSPTAPAQLPAALAGHAGYLAVRLGLEAQQRFELAIAELRLRPAGYDYLSAVAEFGPLSQKDVAAILGIDASRIVALTDALQERGVVARVVDTADRRRNLISLTTAGGDLTARARQIADQVEADLLAGLTEEERGTLRQLLRRALGLSNAQARVGAPASSSSP